MISQNSSSPSLLLVSGFVGLTGARAGAGAVLAFLDFGASATKPLSDS